MEQPVYFWTPDIAPAGIAFYTGKMFPGVERQPVRVGARRQVSGASRARRHNRVVAEERLLTDLNARIRAVNEGPDGALYVLTDGTDGKILRLVKKG